MAGRHLEHDRLFGTRFLLDLVHRDITKEFLNKMVTKVYTWKLGSLVYTTGCVPVTT